MRLQPSCVESRTIRASSDTRGRHVLQLHSLAGCTCCGDLLAGRFSRRHILRAAGALTAFAALQPFTALAANGNYEAMVLGCIDPRMQVPVARYAARRAPERQVQPVRHRRRRDRRGRRAVQGLAQGVLGQSRDLDRAARASRRVIAINHRDCGAAEIAYGKDKVKPREVETETHRAALAEFRKQVGAAAAEAQGRDRPDGRSTARSR